MELIIIRGLPGSGKSFFSKRFKDHLKYENDMYHIHGGEYKFDKNKVMQAASWCQEKTYLALMENKDVVVSNTFVKLDKIKIYLNMSKSFNAVFKIYEMKGAWKSIHNVKEEDMKWMKENWQVLDDELKPYLMELL